MDELLKSGQWWWLLVVPILTGAFALGGSWLGAKLGKTTEHQQWIRNEKTEVYSQLMSMVTQISFLITGMKFSLKSAAFERDPLMKKSAARFRLIAPKHIQNLYSDHRHITMTCLTKLRAKEELSSSEIELYTSTRDKLEDMMRFDLGI